jgi:hypothetical protein
MLFARSRGAELWVSMLEKAYASLHGSYGAIEGGHITDAFCDLTGGIKMSELRLERASQLSKAWVQLEDFASQGNYLLGASSHRSPEGHGDTHKNPLGIVYGHAYAILRVVTVQPEGHRLVQLRNPWGSDEWRGKWSDADMQRPENSRIRHKLGLKEEDDGIFWCARRPFAPSIGSVLPLCTCPSPPTSASAPTSAPTHTHTIALL